jgi:methionyl-tRNA formyltransferase
MKKKVLFLFGEKNFQTKKLILFFKKKVSLKIDYFVDKQKSKKKFDVKNAYFDYIFCFRSKYILSQSDIKKSKFPPINFHPGPPEYRGFGCANYALYENSKYYGVTVHIINKKIDNGQIIYVKRFKIDKNENLVSLLTKTHHNLFLIAKKNIKLLLKDQQRILRLINDNKKEKWSKIIKSKKDLNQFYEISLNSSRIDLKNKLRATVYKRFKPHIFFHRKKFNLE